MNDRDIRRKDRLTRMQTFGHQHAADFTAGSPTRTLFTQLDGIIIQIDTAKAGQTPARVSKSTLLDALTLDLQAIARTARAIELKEPGFAKPYGLPSNPAETPLLTHADAVLALLEDAADDPPAAQTAKAALRAKFVAYELSADFVAALRADRDGIDTATEHNQAETQGGVASTARLSALLQTGADIGTHLDAAMQNKYARTPDALAAWTSASRLERAAQRSKPAAPATPPATVPAK
jgi:hypothetical protein